MVPYESNRVAYADRPVATCGDSGPKRVRAVEQALVRLEGIAKRADEVRSAAVEILSPLIQDRPECEVAVANGHASGPDCLVSRRIEGPAEAIERRLNEIMELLSRVEL